MVRRPTPCSPYGQTEQPRNCERGKGGEPPPPPPLSLSQQCSSTTLSLSLNSTSLACVTGEEGEDTCPTPPLGLCREEGGRGKGGVIVAFLWPKLGGRERGREGGSGGNSDNRTEGGTVEVDLQKGKDLLSHRGKESSPPPLPAAGLDSWPFSSSQEELNSPPDEGGGSGGGGGGGGGGCLVRAGLQKRRRAAVSALGGIPL